MPMKAKFLVLKNLPGNSMTDPISDMIVRIKNASESRKESVVIPYSNLKFEIATALAKEGYVKGVSKKGKVVGKTMEIELLYSGDTPRVQGVRRISKPSRRLYQKAKEIRPVKNGFGSSILSTPKGIVSGRSARKEKIGGEVLFEIW